MARDKEAAVSLPHDSIARNTLHVFVCCSMLWAGWKGHTHTHPQHFNTANTKTGVYLKRGCCSSMVTLAVQTCSHVEQHCHLIAPRSEPNHPEPVS